MPKIASLEELYIEQLKDLYNAEILLIGMLPNLVKSAQEPRIKACFQNHLDQTYRHVERLEKILGDLNQSPAHQRCEAMLGLAKDCRKYFQEDTPSPVRDIAIISHAQQVEHYEIASYNCVYAYALLLGNLAAAELLQHTLDEEIEMEAELTEHAEDMNARAAATFLRR